MIRRVLIRAEVDAPKEVRSILELTQVLAGTAIGFLPSRTALFAQTVAVVLFPLGWSDDEILEWEARHV